MKCCRCQADNPVGARHCNSCGAALDMSQPSEMLGVGCATLLLIIFIPVGLCGIYVAIGTPRDPYGFMPVVYFVIAVSALIAYLAGRKLTKK